MLTVTHQQEQEQATSGLEVDTMADLTRKTANLFDESTLLNGYYDTTSYQYYPNDNYRCFTLLLPAGTYTIFAKSDILTIRLLRVSSSSLGANVVNLDNRSYTFTLPVTETINVSLRNSTTTNDFTGLTIMLNTGSSPLPYEPYWQHSLRKLGTATDTITSLPVDLYADGNNATVGLVGNMQQTGTPTPSSPITPSECGDRTENLFDKSTLVDGKGLDVNGAIINYPKRCTISVPINVSEFDDVTISFASDVSNTKVIYALFNGSTLIRRESAIFSGSSIDVSSGNSLYICFYETTDLVTVTSDDLSNIMLNEGSTALPYEPWGIKIPISSANTTTPVYLGEVESTRRIKKYEITGQESEWNYDSTYTRFTLRIPNAYFTANRSDETPCSHYVSIHDGRPVGDVPDKSIYITSGGGAVYINIVDLTYSSLSDFKTYLQQQYAAGTPVTVWYVLATETTGIVNEPIRKIGEYADTVSGITIPTITGKDTFDVLTTLKPSEVSLAYTGWHDATVKERDGSDWH